MIIIITATFRSRRQFGGLSVHEPPPYKRALHMAHFQLGSFLIGLVSYPGSILIAFLPNDLPNQKRQAVKQPPDDHVGAELETSHVYSCAALREMRDIVLPDTMFAMYVGRDVT